MGSNLPLPSTIMRHAPLKKRKFLASYAYVMSQSSRHPVVVMPYLWLASWTIDIMNINDVYELD